MEKTVQITIGGTQFPLTESAYDTLHSYLDRLKAHFGDTADSAEIMRDIEARIAEKFIDARHKLVTQKDVAAVIAEIGDASAFGDGTETADVPKEPKEKEAAGRKRLYRDMDNAYLGGVSAGIAAYFNIDPIWIRLAFLISVMSGGAGVVIYLILWFLIPEAKSVSQKLEMSGRPVNLDTIAGIVKERFEEAEKSGAIARGKHAVHVVMTQIFGYIGSVVGALLSLGSFFAIIGTSVLLGVVMINWNAPWNDIPHKEAISPALLRSALIVGYTAIIIPLVFIFSLGYRWMKRRTILTTTVGFGLMGIWALSLIGSGVMATRIVGDYVAYTESSPEYAQTVEEYTLEPFTSIDAEHTHVTVLSGDTYTVRISGRRMDMGNASTSVQNGVLTVSSIEHNGPCIFCHHSTPSVTVTVPALETVSAHSGSISFDKLSVPSLTLDVQNSNVNGTVRADTLVIRADSSWTGVSATAETVTIDVKNGRVELDGSTDSLSITARNASVDTESMRSATTSIDAQNSSVHVWTTSLNTINDRASDVQNAGTEAGVSETNETN